MIESVAVIGQGYVGLPLAVHCASTCRRVIGLDSNESRINQLRRGKSPIKDVEDKTLLRILETGVYEPSSDMGLLKSAQVIVICVPTPLNTDGNPDLSFVLAAVDSIAKYAVDGALIINESTSYPGTLRDVIKSELGKTRPNSRFLFAVAPERIDPGNTDWDLNLTPRIIGGLDEESTKAAIAFYGRFCDRVIEVSSAEVAETAKLLENSFRQVNIALVTELSEFCERIQISAHEVIKAASSKPYGFMPFYPGIGVGGHCIPIDPIYLAWSGYQHGVSFSLIERADSINRNRPIAISRKIVQIPNIRQSRVLIAGLSYKPGIADLRESPSIEILRLLHSQLGNVFWWDPVIESVGLEERASLEEHFDLVLLMYEFNEQQLIKLSESCEKLIDCSGRNLWFEGVKPI